MTHLLEVAHERCRARVVANGKRGMCPEGPAFAVSRRGLVWAQPAVPWPLMKGTGPAPEIEEQTDYARGEICANLVRLGVITSPDWPGAVAA